MTNNSIKLSAKQAVFRTRFGLVQTPLLSYSICKTLGTALTNISILMVVQYYPV